MINKWGSGSEISLHLPATATSTLHTDTIDYVRGTDIYSHDNSAMMYDNNPGNRRGLSHILSQYQKTPSLYSESTSPTALQLGLVLCQKYFFKLYFTRALLSILCEIQGHITIFKLNRLDNLNIQK